MNELHPTDRQTTAIAADVARSPALRDGWQPAHFSIAVPQDARRRLALAWFGLGLVALLASGLFSILLVLTRTPQLQALFAVADFFRVALVIHVDLSVLVWFLAFGGGVWTLSSGLRWLALGWLAFGLAMLGTLVMCLAPFFQNATPVMANYVPVLDGSVFLTGLGIFGAGIVLLCLRSMGAATPVGTTLSGNGTLRFGLNASLVATAVAALCFVWSWLTLPSNIDPRVYYELLFWGGGHVLQFVYSLLMLTGWIWLASALGAKLPLSPRVVTLLFAVALLAVFLTPLTYLAYPVTSVEHHRLQTLLMRYGGGLVIGPIVLALLVALRHLPRLSAQMRPLRTCLMASLVLFCAGGIIGFMITGNNVRIPAHYHGSIVGVTLALMGVVYMLLPQFGFRAPQSATAAWQPVIYGGGQLLHIVGLVWSGGYGVQRKVAGAEQVLRTSQETWGMGLMGLGGLIAIVGGIMFVVQVALALTKPPLGSTRVAESVRTVPALPAGSIEWLRRVGTVGSALSLAILGASVLLRLCTVLGSAGQTQSILPAQVEQAARLLHRFSASSVAVLALCAVVLGWKHRQASAHLVRPIATVVLATLVLAIVGPLTPGYRIAAITVVNVTVGMLLLMAFWWLREAVACPTSIGKPIDALTGATLLCFLVHVGVGAAASAYAMHGLHWPAFFHLASLLVFIVLAGNLLRQRISERLLDLATWSLLGMLILQMVLGYFLMWQTPRPVGLSFIHAMLSPLLALALVSLVLRGHQGTLHGGQRCSASPYNGARFLQD